MTITMGNICACANRPKKQRPADVGRLSVPHHDLADASTEQAHLYPPPNQVSSKYQGKERYTETSKSNTVRFGDDGDRRRRSDVDVRTRQPRYSSSNGAYRSGNDAAAALMALQMQSVTYDSTPSHCHTSNNGWSCDNTAQSVSCDTAQSVSCDTGGGCSSTCD